ncbi:MAG: hypothetical protein GY865_02325, partial [candidate division Zixibacteria bacterium]|nr:hypothetical protein [candidate division Zixibacteria bacterium]
FGEVLVTLDGLKIYEPFHVKEVDGGAISIIDVAAIDGIDLITGGFGAEYGDKMSGVFNIKSKQIKPGPNKFSAGLSLLNFKTMGEGRFAKNKGSWLISARRGYIDYVLKLTGDDDHVKPTYYDIYSKIDYQFDNNCLISASFLHAGDKLRYNGGDKYDGNFLTSKYGDSYAWLNMSYTPSDKLTINSILSTGKVYYNKLWEVMDKRFVGIDYSVHDKRDY